MEKAVEIERRKCSLISDKIPETKIKHNVEAVVKMTAGVLHVDFSWIGCREQEG